MSKQLSRGDEFSDICPKCAGVVPYGQVKVILWAHRVLCRGIDTKALWKRLNK